jgi:hypothetical protein
MGGVSLASGVYPAKPANNGAFWKVTAGGTVGGVEYGVGDTLVYSKSLDQFYKIDNTESVTSVAGRTGVVTLTKADVDLNNVDNTSDANKPISAATQIALNAKAPLDSPAFTGNPTAPTPATTDNDTSVATTAFVRAAMALFGVGGAGPRVADLNSQMTSGLFTCDTSTLNRPASDSAGAASCLVSAHDADDVRQVYFFRDGRIATRVMAVGTWSAWQELWHTGNLAKQTGPNDATPGAVVMADNFATRMGNIGAPINLMRDSGRFGGAVSPQSLYVPAAFANATGFLAAYNGSTWADAGQFFHDNSTNGGARGALTQDVIDFLTAAGRTGIYARYGVEFHIGTLTQGAGTSVQSVGPDSVARYLSVISSNQPCTGPGSRATFAGWLKAKTGSAHVLAAGVDLYINGVLTPGNYALPANTWVHVRQVITARYGYDNGFPRVYATPGAQIQFALPAHFAGEVDVGLHTAPIGHVPGLQVVGVVSQAAGEMTGAIIERGSNANGEYVRFADGTQICRVRVTQADVAISVPFMGGFRSSGYTWSPPAGFVGDIEFLGSPYSSADAFSINIGGAGSYFFTAITSQPAATRTCNLFAIGRWY